MPVYRPEFNLAVEQLSCRFWRQRRAYRDLSEHGVAGTRRKEALSGSTESASVKRRHRLEQMHPWSEAATRMWHGSVACPSGATMMAYRPFFPLAVDVDYVVVGEATRLNSRAVSRRLLQEEAGWRAQREFIGSHLAQTLLANGNTVTGVDSFTDYYGRPKKERNLEQVTDYSGFRLVEADLTGDLFPGLVKGADGIFHLAAQPGVRGSWGSTFDIWNYGVLLAAQKARAVAYISAFGTESRSACL
jgi:NAD dependent epimerase/dehydratase family